jgi:hypothetical protein
MTKPNDSRCSALHEARSLSLTEAAAYWGELTGAPAPRASTLSRWALHGIRGHQLRSVVVGGRVLVSEADLIDLFEKMNGGRGGNLQRIPDRRPRTQAGASPATLNR